MARGNAVKNIAAQDQQRFGVSVSEAEERQMRGEDTGATGAETETTETTETGAEAEQSQRADAGAETEAQPGVDKPGEKELPQRTKMVPHEALHEERQRRQKAEERAEEIQRKADERLTAIISKLGEQKPAAPAAEVAKPVEKTEIPDPDQDALGALRATTAEIKLLKDFKEKYEAGQASTTEAQVIIGKATSLEAEYERTVMPDYRQASQFMAESRKRELTALGNDPIQVQQIMRQEAIELAANAIQQGKNPAEVIAALAKSRGYQKQTTKQEHEEMGRYAATQETEFKTKTTDYDDAMTFLKTSRAGEYAAVGHTPEQIAQLLERDILLISRAAFTGKKNPAEMAYSIAKARGYQPKAATQTGEQRLDNVRRGQEASRSLSNAGGSARAKTGIDALLGMSDAEFARAMDKMSPDQMRQHFGD